MANKEENKLDNFARKVLKATTPEHVRPDFTKNVMGQLPKSSVNQEVFQYKPLISTQAWIISGIVVVLSLMLLASLTHDDGPNLFGFPNFGLSGIHFNWIPKLFTLFNYQVVEISVFMFTLYFILEVFVLNTWFKKGSI